MRKLSFRCLSALLAVFMLLSTASTIVFAEGEEAVTDPVANKDLYNDVIVDYNFEDIEVGTELQNGDEYIVSGGATVTVSNDNESLSELGPTRYRQGKMAVL